MTDIPVTIIEKDLSNRIASTIRHNRARVTHDVESMSIVVTGMDRGRNRAIFGNGERRGFTVKTNGRIEDFVF